MTPNGSVPYYGLPPAESIFGAALSDAPFDDHLTRAYYEGARTWQLPPRPLRWRLPAALVPPGVHAVVDSASQAQAAKERVATAREVIRTNRAALDHEVTRLIHHRPTRPNVEYASVRRVRTFSHGVKMVTYAFNPYRLGLALLDDFGEFIDVTVQSNRRQFAQLSRLCMEARRLRDDTELICGELWLGAMWR